MTIKYVADDGTEFLSQKKCVEYEIPKVTLEERENINKAIETISHVCYKVKSLASGYACSVCPFRYNASQCSFVNRAPLNWEKLHD